MSSLLFHVVCLWSINFVDLRHFNGGTITWKPIDPYDNSTHIGITITQSYTWTYPLISCSTDVPISTAGRSSQNSNLTCMADCNTDGGYSSAPIDILTDCQSASSSLGMLSSQRSKNVSLMADAHFYLSFVGSAWVSLNDPAESGLQWSIVTYIDLRRRLDGFINTPPVATVISPQYAIVNQTIEIQIPVLDMNVGDDVRCRWSEYIPGYRRRRQTNRENVAIVDNFHHLDEEKRATSDFDHFRYRRQICPTGCNPGDNCNSNPCKNPVCPAGSSCNSSLCCGSQSTTVAITTTGATTTTETPGTIKSTSSFPHRQAIDECGGICYPQSLPNTTTLSNCTITFTGTKVNTWYGVSIQVEDFIDKNSTTAMSSVPVQLLIYVRGPPSCSLAPLIVPLNVCLEVQVGASFSFDVYASNLCDPSISVITDLILTPTINGMTSSALKNVSMNASLSYVTYTWTPQASQVGSQLMCFVAYTDEQVRSLQYCVTFTVEIIANSCVVITTTSTQSTTDTTTSTTTSTSSITTTTLTNVIVTTTTTAGNSKGNVDWPLIIGLSILAFFLCLCCLLCCLYWLLWSPKARRRRQKRHCNTQDPVHSLAIERETGTKTNLSSVKRNRDTPTKDYLINNAENIHRTTPSDLHIELSETPVPTVTISPIVKVTKIHRDHLKNCNDENGYDELIIPPSSSRQERNDSDTILNASLVNQPNMPRATMTPKPPEVTFEKIPRNQRMGNLTSCRPSTVNMNVIGLEQPTMDTSLMVTPMDSNPQSTKTNSTVKVTKLPRSRSTIRPTDS